MLHVFWNTLYMFMYTTLGLYSFLSKIYWVRWSDLMNSIKYIMYTLKHKITITLTLKINHCSWNSLAGKWVSFGCLTPQSTTFQLYMWRHIDEQVDWRSWTYAIDISYGSLLCPLKHGANLFTVIPRNHPISVAFHDAHGDTEDLYYHLKPSGSHRG